jgi:D-mannonate dehydratase
MNIIKRLIKKIKKQNPYVECQTKEADILIGTSEKLSREQIRERFDNYYKVKDKKSWENAHK